MGFASIGGRTFRIDPNAVSWSYSVKTKVTETVGGRVVQVFGTRLNNMLVTGTVGVAGWREAEAFLTQVKRWADEQVDTRNPRPLRFVYPPNRWDFKVFVVGMTDPNGDGNSAVTHDNANYAPKYVLDLFIAEDNTQLAKVATDHFIERLADGVGWKQTTYNGPLSQAEVEALLTRSGNPGDLDGYLKARLKEQITNPGLPTGTSR